MWPGFGLCAHDMTTLALDTCFGACSVAVTWGVPTSGEPTGGVFRCEMLGRGHAERLLPMIAEAVAETPFAIMDLERIAVTIGPGTFTGQRVGLAAARALVLATGAEIAPLSSLVAMAHTARAMLGPDVPPEVSAAPLAVAVDARRGEIYFEVVGPGLAPVASGPSLVTPLAAAALLAERGDVAMIVGSGARAVVEAAALQGFSLAERLPDLQPNMRFVPLDGLVFSDVPPKPLYLRPPDAKPQDGKPLKRAP